MKTENVFKGDLTAKAGEVYEYTEITGNVDARKADRCAFPQARTIGGYASATGATVCQFPQARTIGGGAYADKATGCQFPQARTIGGYASAAGATVCQFPQARTIGDDAYAAGATVCQFPQARTIGGAASADNATVCQFRKDLKQNDPAAAARCRDMLLSSFAAAGYSFADGILARIVSQRGPVSRVIICGKTEISYVVSDDEGNNAHGDTLAEARADLMVKRTSKDLTQFRAWGLDKVVSKSDAILAYRSITGACSKGVRLWLEQRQTPEKIAVKDIIELTKGAYGAEKFAGFFVKEVAEVS